MLYNWLKEIDFAQPLVFAQFVWIPVLIWWYVKKYNKKQATIKVSSVQAFNVSSAKSRFPPPAIYLTAIGYQLPGTGIGAAAKKK
ncbi:MAG: hypothetical protein WDO16_19100 [Bacteroidota bacterium]